MIQQFIYNPVGFFYLFKKETHRFLKVYIQTIIAPLLSNMLFLGVFGGVLRTREVGLQGIGYLSFLAPGLVAMGAIQASFQNPSFSLIVQKFQKTIKELNSYPMTTMEKALAIILGGTLRGFIVGFLTYIATIYFVGYRIAYPLYFILSIIAVSFIFASLGLIAGLVFSNFEKLNFLLAIILTPLVYFGGVFFELSKLPGIFSYLMYVNPLFPLINITRFSYLGVFEGQIWFHFAFLLLTVILSFSWAIYTFKKGIGLKD